jgi:hypothetical protein
VRNIDKQTAKTISAELKEAAEAVFAKHGLTLDKISTNYGELYRFKVEAHVADVDEDGVDRNSSFAVAFLAWPSQFGLTAEALGKQATINGKAWTFAGVAATRRKYPLAFKGDDGKIMLFSETAARHLPAEVRVNGGGQ